VLIVTIRRRSSMLKLLRFAIPLAVITTLLVAAAPAAAQTTVTYRVTFVENAGGQATCPPGTSCGTANIAGVGHVTTQMIVFNACGPNCHLRTITFEDGSTILVRESIVNVISPGNSGSGANAPIFFEISQTIVSGTGVFTGVTGSGTGRVNTNADGGSIITASGTITFP
jgi:hypothetical protein